MAELVEENARLRDAIASRDRILAVAAHELRNPMTPLLGRVEFLRRMASQSDFRREQAEEGLRQVEWLIRQYIKRATTLLDVSRLTSGKLRLDRPPIDLGDLTREVCENFRPIAAHAGSSLEVRLSLENVIVVGDRVALEEILENLLSNAVKYGEGSPISVSVDVERGAALLRVQDGGPGISPDDQARIFEQFERVARPGEDRGGFGVGLWIVRQFSEAMAGSIEVTSTPGGGSTFCVTLPLQSSKEHQ